MIEEDISEGEIVKYLEIREIEKKKKREASSIEGYSNSYETYYGERPNIVFPLPGEPVIYKGHSKFFWFPKMLKDADELLEIGKKYTIKTISVYSSWCAVTLNEIDKDVTFALGWFKTIKEIVN